MLFKHTRRLDTTKFPPCLIFWASEHSPNFGIFYPIDSYDTHKLKRSLRFRPKSVLLSFNYLFNFCRLFWRKIFSPFLWLRAIHSMTTGDIAISIIVIWLWKGSNFDIVFVALSWKYACTYWLKVITIIINRFIPRPSPKIHCLHDDVLTDKPD